jgi:hypothetical protein
MTDAQEETPIWNAPEIAPPTNPPEEIPESELVHSETVVDPQEDELASDEQREQWAAEAVALENEQVGS